MRALSLQELEDILVGCTSSGCGGGGSFGQGLEQIRSDYAANLRFHLMATEELGDDDYAASPYGLGSTAPPKPEQLKPYAHLPRIDQNPVEASFQLLERHRGKEFAAVIPGEIGPGNTAAALSTAAHLGIPALDADTVGRSTPEINQNSVLVSRVSLLPAAAVSLFGDEFLLTTVAEPAREEDILRSLAVVSLGLGVTDTSIPGRIAKKPGVLVCGSISQAGRLGKAYREAAQDSREAIRAVLKAGNGYQMFEGQVADFHWKDEAGFLIGEVELSGTGSFQGASYRTWYKNEHIISWQDDKVSVLPPDLITLVSTETGRALPNPEFERGQAVTVLGFPAPALWRTPRGLKAFGPKYFGFEASYIPIEKQFNRSDQR